jgi:peptide deformylase
MAIQTIVTGEKNPILHRKTKEVKMGKKALYELLLDMADTLKEANGAGLAAPQIGRTERVCLAMVGKKIIALINPDITWRSDEKEIAEEGCLSLPKVWINVERSSEIVVNYRTPAGKKRETKLEGFDARVVQHEVDHLDGILITDHEKKTSAVAAE